MARTKKFEKEIDVIKASRKGSREAELETSTGFNGTHKVHKSKKSYSRKPKHKGRIEE